MELMGLAKVVEELTAMENLQNADNTKKILIQLSDGTVFECSQTGPCLNALTLK